MSDPDLALINGVEGWTAAGKGSPVDAHPETWAGFGVKVHASLLAPDSGPLVGVGLVALLMTLRDVATVSPGKRIMRLDIVTRDDLQTETSADQRLKRNLLLFLWPLTAPLELLVLRQHPLVLRVGDMWADTEIVRQRAQR